MTARPPSPGAMVVRPTARGLGVALVTTTLVVIVVVTGSLGPVALVAALGFTMVTAPLQAWARARRSAGVVHAFAHAVPPMVPVGGSSTLEVTIVNASGPALAPVGLERPEGRWKAGKASWSPGVAAPHGDQTVLPHVSTGRRRLRHRLAPSTVDLLRVRALDHGASSSAGFAVPTGRRGVLVLSPRRVWAHDALGLAGVAVAETPDVVVVVHPRRASGVSLPFGAATGATPAQQSSPASRPTGNEVGGELADLRPYVPGDRLHLLHWPAFARYGALLVRRFEPEAGGVVRIVVDDRAGVHRRGAFEQSLSAALAIVELARDLDVTVELATFSGWSTTVAPTPQGVARILPMLSTLQPTRVPVSGRAPVWVDTGSGTPTIVTTLTGESTLPSALRGCAKVVVR